MTAIQTIYPTIKAIDAKALDWQAAFTAMKARYVESLGGKVAYCHEMALAEWDAVKGVGGKRLALVQMAVGLAHKASICSHFQQPSEETLAWGGFLGGTHLVWTNEEAAEQATGELLAFIMTFKKGE